jgi:hypothetical protein
MYFAPGTTPLIVMLGPCVSTLSPETTPSEVFPALSTAEAAIVWFAPSPTEMGDGQEEMPESGSEQENETVGGLFRHPAAFGVPETEAEIDGAPRSTLTGP